VTNEDYVILGNTFLESFYTVYDFDKGQVGIAVNSRSFMNANVTTLTLPTGNNNVNKTLIIITSICVFVVFLTLCLFCRSKYKQRELDAKNTFKRNNKL